MRKFFVLLCVFSLFLNLSCSKKSESNETTVTESFVSEETNEVVEETNEDADASNEFEDSGLEGFLIEDDAGNEDEEELKESKASAEQVSSSTTSEDDESDELEASETEEEVIPEPEIEKPKDLVPPGPVTELTGYYNGAKNKVIISWKEPEDVDYSYVKVISNGNDEGISKKGSTSFEVKAETLGNYDISVVTYDDSGNEGPATAFSTEAKFFSSASMPPLAGTAGKGRPIRVVVKGVGFTTEGITTKDFKVTCAEDSYVSKKATVKIVDDGTVYVDATIPRKSGSYNVAVQCGNNKVSGSFKVLDVSPIGTIEKAKDGTPVAILAGYNSLGLPFGVALEEQKGLKWATSFGYSEKFEEIMAIVPQQELGAGSALNADITGDLDGYDNWKTIVAEDNKASNGSYAKDAYPLFYYASNYGKSMPAGYKDGWFIPSLFELCQIYANKAKINEVISLIGDGTPLGDDFYWSSSQCDEEDDKACAVRFNTGSIFKYKRKSDSIYGRCVIMMY